MEIPRYQSRVGVPNVPRGRALRASDFGGALDLSGVGEAFATVGRVLEKQDEAEAVSYTSKVTATAARHFTTRIPELKQTATDHAKGYALTVDQEWTDWTESVLADAPNDLAAKMARERLQQLHQKSYEDAVGYEATQRHIGQLADFDASTKDLATAAFNDPANVAKYLSQGAADLMAAESTWMQAATAAERKHTVRDMIIQNAVKGLIATNPDEAVARLQSGYFDDGLGGQKSAFLATAKNAALQMENERKARIKEAEAAREKAEKQARLETQNDLLARLNDPDAPAPSVTEILKSDLAPTGQGSKDFFIDLANKKARGQDVNYTNPRTYQQLAGLIAQRKIIDPEVLLTHVGSGLSIDGFNKLKSDMEAAATTAGQAELKMKRRAIDYASTQITGSSLLGGNDALGEQDLYSFEFELDAALEKGREQGLTFDVMLNPRHEKNVIEPLVEKYRLTPQERLHRQVQQLNPPEPAPRPDALPASEKPAATGVTPRQPGETIQQYLERTGRK